MSLFESPRLFVIDGMSLLFRSFYAMGTRLTGPDGTPIGAVYGFIKILVKVLKEQNPTHVAVCWDVKEKTFRHERYPLYKSNRGETPPEIIPQIILIQKLLDTLGLPSFKRPGFEADDLAGCLAKFFSDYGEVYLLTADKDYMQLVTDRVFLFSLKKGDDYDIVGREKVIDYFGVPPEKVIDVLAITGDTSDFVPGVKGIGDKGAAKLVSEFGSLENIYANLDHIKTQKLRDALIQHQENAFLSKFLVTIDSNVELNLSELSLRFTLQHLQNNTAFKEELEALRMQSIVKSIGFREMQDLAEAAPIIEPKEDPHWGKCHYHLVQTKAELETLWQKIRDPNLKYFALDTETTGLDILEDVPIGVSLCFETHTAYYIPAHAQHLTEGAEFTAHDVWHGLQSALANTQARVVAHNLKFDAHQLENVSVTLLNSKIACTMVAAWLCNPVEEFGFSLDALTLKHFQFVKTPTSALIGKETKRKTMLEVPLHILSNYACEDADATYRLWTVYQEKLKDDAAAEKLFFEMEMPLLTVLVKMERVGVHIDTPYLEQLAAQVQEKISALEKEVYATVGREFNIASPRQLGDVLFDEIKVHEALGYTGKLARTTQGYKTDAGVLDQFKAHPFIKLIQQYRELSKLLSTYILALPQLVKKSSGRIHTNFHQIGTSTGRLSSSHPNLQNVPIRTEWGKKVRAAFSPSSAQHCLVSADYSQIELRVLAHLCKDENLVQAFRSGLDIHRQTAAQILGKKLEDVTPEERGHAKAINFGLIYGMGAQRLARDQEIPLAEAKRFIEKYFLTFARVRHYLDSMRQQAHETGAVRTHFGRPRPIPSIHSKNAMEAKFAENIAINSPIQGTAADVMKIGMINAQRELEKHSPTAKLILQVHDELVVECLTSESEKVVQILKDTMENAVAFDVPMTVDVKVGRNWLEA